MQSLVACLACRNHLRNRSYRLLPFKAKLDLNYIPCSGRRREKVTELRKQSWIKKKRKKFFYFKMQTHFAKAETIISLSVSLERWSHRPVKQAGCHLHSDRPAPPLPLGGLWFHFQFQSPVLARGWQVFLHFPQARLSCPELCLGLAWGGTDQLDLYHFEAFFSRLPGGPLPPERPLPVRCTRWPPHTVPPPAVSARGLGAA